MNEVLQQVRSTIVSYPGGRCEDEGELVAVVPTSLHGGCFGVVLDRSCFHPKDFRWPDQPSDKGHLLLNGQQLDVIEAVKGHLDSDGQWYLDQEIELKRDEAADATLCVVHLVRVDCSDQMGVRAKVVVDKAYRFAVSVGHTASHIMGLAFNEVLAGYWRKEVALDERGFPDFSEYALQCSKVFELGGRDRFRLGKSLKKRGFNNQDFWDNLVEVEVSLNESIGAMVVDESVCFEMMPNEGPLTARRYWQMQTADREEPVCLPCGGTHLQDLSAIESIHCELSRDESNLLVDVKVSLLQEID